MAITDDREGNAFVGGDNLFVQNVDAIIAAADDALDDCHAVFSEDEAHRAVELLLVLHEKYSRAVASFVRFYDNGESKLSRIAICGVDVAPRADLLAPRT